MFINFQLDVVAFANLAQIYFIDKEVSYSLRDYMTEHCPNLVGLVNRMKERCFPDWDDICATLDLNSHLPKPLAEESKDKEGSKDEKEGDKEKEPEDKDIEKEKVNNTSFLPIQLNILNLFFRLMRRKRKKRKKRIQRKIKKKKANEEIKSHADSLPRQNFTYPLFNFFLILILDKPFISLSKFVQMIVIKNHLYN